MSDVIATIIFGNCKATNLYCRILFPSLIIGNFAIEFIPKMLIVRVKHYFVVQQTIVCNGFIFTTILKQIG